LYQRALAIDEKSFGREHSAVANSLNNLGSKLIIFAAETRQS
jgi:hypothetical protein